MALTLTLVVRTRSRDARPLELIRSAAACSPMPDELVVVDSGSHPRVAGRLERWAGEGLARPDGSRATLRLVRIPPDRYGSAAALNAGFEVARGRFVAVLSQDVVLRQSGYFGRLLRGFDAPEVAGVFARQVPGRHASAVARKDLVRLYPPAGRPPRFPDHWFCNTCSIVRRAVWSELPFREQAATAEDHDWGIRVRGCGLRVRYVPEARVIHHHDYPDDAAIWSRFFAEGRGLAVAHGEAPGVLRVLGDCVREIGSDGWWLARRRRLREWPAAARMRAVKHLALHRGARGR